MSSRSLRQGFTLIEIMIVVVIIGILAVALFPRLLGAIGKSSDEGRKVGLKSMSAVLLQYKNDNGFYPKGEGCTAGGYGVLQGLIDGGYIDESKMPVDPNKGTVTNGSCTGGYYYKSIEAETGAGDGSSYILVARLDSGNKGNSANVPTGTRDSIGKALQPNTGRYYVELGL